MNRFLAGGKASGAANVRLDKKVKGGFTEYISTFSKLSYDIISESIYYCNCVLYFVFTVLQITLCEIGSMGFWGFGVLGFW